MMTKALPSGFDRYRRVDSLPGGPILTGEGVKKGESALG